ncbi:hypothetical protein GCM10028801_02140 [Nocardioides maradonensis]
MSTDTARPDARTRLIIQTVAVFSTLFGIVETGVGALALVAAVSTPDDPWNILAYAVAVVVGAPGLIGLVTGVAAFRVRRTDVAGWLVAVSGVVVLVPGAVILSFG